MQALVAAGWFRDVDEIVLGALRRFLESHREDLMEEMVREDVAWGLHGAD
jgi:Arc/MetJ-type ribon-helix-helix transcriptional regulator